MSSAKAKMVRLKSSDGKIFEAEKAAITAQSEIIRSMIEDRLAGEVIPLPNVTSKILEMVIGYCKRHVDSSDDGDLKASDAELMKSCGDDALIDLTVAAYALKIDSLHDLTCQTIANLIKGMKVEEVREFFNIENDFTPQEEEEIRRENAWAFE